MPHRAYKFGSRDNIKFIKIYRKYECLWNTENINYKNRDARNAALLAFSKELGIEHFGPKDITMKIKNMRSQYLQERKKVISSGTGVRAENVYVPKLPWYNCLDSFLRKPSEFRPSMSNTSDETTLNTFSSQENDEEDSVSEIKFVDILNSSSHISQTKKEKSLDIDSANDRLDENGKRGGQSEDDLDMFGKYVASSLRKLDKKSIIYAQDEIQAILSKYKLQNL